MGLDVGSRIRDARLRRGMNQDQLAGAIGGEKWTISKIENGTREVKSVELAEIADALGVSMRDLLGTRKALAPLALAHRLGDAVLDAPSAQQASRHLRGLLEVQALLDELEMPEPSRTDPVISTFTPSTTDPRRAGEELAGVVRGELALGSQPVGDLDVLMEQAFAIDVVGLPLGDGKDVLCGMCVVTPGFRVALYNTSMWPSRQRFTLAHELAHILFGDPHDEHHAESYETMNSTDTPEVRANAFAAELLVPAAAMTSWVERAGGMSESVFAHLLFTYQVSVQTLTYRLADLAQIDAADKARYLDLSVGTLAHRHNHVHAYREMGGSRDVVRPPTRLYERALQAYCDGRIGIGPLAGVVGADEDELRAELDAAGLAPELEEDVDVLALL